MKTIIISVITLALGAILVHAQGTIQIFGRPLPGGGNPAAGVYTNTSSLYFPQPPSTPGVVAGPTSSGNTAPFAYIYALLIAPIVTSADSSPLGPDWTQAMIYNSVPLSPIVATNFSTVPGAVEGTGGASGVAVNGWTPGTSMNIMLVGWTPSLGTSWSQVSEQYASGDWFNFGYFGYSAIANFTSGGPLPAAPTNIFDASGIQGFDLYSVAPEPATLALAGLGGLSMLFLRHRKT